MQRILNIIVYTRLRVVVRDPLGDLKVPVATTGACEKFIFSSPPYIPVHGLAGLST